MTEDTEDTEIYYLCEDGKCLVQYAGSRELAQAYADEQGYTLSTTPSENEGE